MCLVAINMLLRWQNTSGMQFMLDKRKISILDMASKRPGTMADTVIAKCVQNR